MHLEHFLICLAFAFRLNPLTLRMSLCHTARQGNIAADGGMTETALPDADSWAGGVAHDDVRESKPRAQDGNQDLHGVGLAAKHNRHHGHANDT